MKEKLVKILEKTDDVSELSKENIIEYVQTKQMVDRLGRFVVNPFQEKMKARSDGGYLLRMPEVEIKLTESRTPNHYSAGDTIGLLKVTLGTAMQNYEAGKQMYGVKRFGDTVAMDAEYLQYLMEGWNEAVIGETVRTSFSANGPYQEIAKANTGNLIFIDEPIKWINPDTTNLYLAADMQVKVLDKKVVKPFETAFKNLSVRNPAETTRDLHEYDGLTVFVKTIPRLESNSKRAIENLNESIEYFAGLKRVSSEPLAWRNDSLINPRTYVSIEGLLDIVNKEASFTDIKFRQEMAILYKPDPAIILSE